MRPVKIGRQSPGYTSTQSARIFADKKIKALIQARDDGIPSWYKKAMKWFPLLGKLISVDIMYPSKDKEIIFIYILGFKISEVTFIYY